MANSFLQKPETIWQHLKNDWIIKKSDIRDLGINPDDPWQDITLGDLYILSDFMDVTIGNIVD